MLLFRHWFPALDLTTIFGSKLALTNVRSTPEKLAWDALIFSVPSYKLFYVGSSLQDSLFIHDALTVFIQNKLKIVKLYLTQMISKIYSKSKPSFHGITTVFSRHQWLQLINWISFFPGFCTWKKKQTKKLCT